MKTQNTIKMALIALLVMLGVSFSGKLHAQICVGSSGYTITNTLSHAVIVHYEVFDGTCGTIASSGGSSIAANGGVLVIPNTAFTGAVDIYITLAEVNGDYVDVNWAVNGFNQPCNGLFHPGQSGSTIINGYPWNILWSCSSTLIW